MGALKDILHIIEQDAYVDGSQIGSLTTYNIVRGDEKNGCLVTKRVQSANNVHELYWAVNDFSLDNDYLVNLFSLITKVGNLITNRSEKDEPLHYMSIYHINGIFNGAAFSLKVEHVYKPGGLAETHSLISELEILKKIDTAKEQLKEAAKKLKGRL